MTKVKTSMGGAHELRARAVIRELRRRGSVSQSALARSMGMTTSTLGNTVALLKELDLVRGSDTRLRLNPDLGFVAGIDVRRGVATLAITRLDFEPLAGAAHKPITFETPVDARSSLRQIAAVLAQQLEIQAGSDRVRARLVGVGLTLPGPILRRRNPAPVKDASAWDRRVRAGLIMPGWDEVDVAGELATLLKHECKVFPPRHAERRIVWIENDSSAGALGVHTEALATFDDPPDDLLYVRITDGLGAGIINKNHLLTGASGFAGELGHVTADPSGALCPTCGGSGCLETLCSNRAVVDKLRGLAMASAADRRLASLGRREHGTSVEQELVAYLTSGHPAVARTLTDAGWHLGVVLAHACCLLNPSWIVLDGVLPEFRPATSDGSERESRPFVEGVVRALQRETLPQAFEEVRVKTWSEVNLHSHALSPQLLGALALVVDHLGDAYLLKPIQKWMREGLDAPVDFAAPCPVPQLGPVIP